MSLLPTDPPVHELLIFAEALLVGNLKDTDDAFGLGCRSEGASNGILPGWVFRQATGPESNGS